jgi:hypothetical protein
VSSADDDDCLLKTPVRWLASGEMGEDPRVELSGVTVAELLDELVNSGTSDSSGTSSTVVLMGGILPAPAFGYRSGALYESIFVVDTSSTGAEILLRMPPLLLEDENGFCFVVNARDGIGPDICGLVSLTRLVVNARAIDMVTGCLDVDGKLELYCLYP